MGALVRESMVQGEQLKLVIKYHKGSNWTPISLQDKVECSSQCLVIRNRYKKRRTVARTLVFTIYIDITIYLYD